MDNYIENSIEETVETTEAWVAPELKKLDVEEITAGAIDTGVPDAGEGWS